MTTRIEYAYFRLSALTHHIAANHINRNYAPIAGFWHRKHILAF